MDLMADVAKSFAQAGSGVLANKVETISRQVSVWNKNIDREQSRIDNYTSMLQAQFSAMTASISSSKSMGDYLTAVLGTKSGSQ
jgi:flagellar capping protein FliD